MKLSSQKEQILDSSIPKLTDSKTEQVSKGYNEIKNNQIMARVNIFSSVTKANHIIAKDLEEEWEVYLFDNFSRTFR